MKSYEIENRNYRTIQLYISFYISILLFFYLIQNLSQLRDIILYIYILINIKKNYVHI